MNSIQRSLRSEQYEIVMISDLTKDVLGVYPNKRKCIVAFIDLALFFGAKFRLTDQSQRGSFNTDGLRVIFQKSNP